MKLRDRLSAHGFASQHDGLGTGADQRRRGNNTLRCNFSVHRLGGNIDFDHACRTEAEAQEVRAAIAARMRECGLELHPEKTKMRVIQAISAINS